MTSQPVPTTINGQPLLSEAVAFELGRLIRFYRQHMSAEQVRAQLPALREKAVEQAIGARLLFDEAARLDLSVPEAEVDARLAAMRKQAGGTVKFNALLKRQGLDKEALRAQVRRGRQVDRLVEQITAAAAEPSEEEMRAHFEAHRSEYTRAERAQAQHILIKTKADVPEARAAARARLEVIRARVAAGADFASEAAAHSDCPSGRAAGGSLGWVGRGMMVPALDRAVFGMQTGALSEIVETPLGLHLIRKTGHEEAAPAEYEDVRESVREFLRHVKRGEALAAHVADLKAKATIC